jgi:ubiquinone/menaquinone biosynthesis C-methylase UbiE
MATPWDRAAAGYLEQWVPRFVPYHLDLISEVTLSEGERVLVTSAGPGAEALAAARAVGPRGLVRATDKSEAMVAICADTARKGGFRNLECAQADSGETSGGPWDAILCAFGLWQVPDLTATLRSWGEALAPRGKVGVLTWGPPESDDPFEQIVRALHELEPAHSAPRPQIEAGRERMAAMFEGAGLALLRHTVVRHTLNFRSTEAFVHALREASSWRRIWEEIGDARMERVAARFYDALGGPDVPLSFSPPATLAIAARPGAEVELALLPSYRVPKT